MTVTVETVGSLRTHQSAWEALAGSAIEPNPFYEPWMLLPAIEAFGQKVDFRFLLVWAPDPTSASGPPVLCGLFPFERRPRYHGLPLIHLCLWQPLQVALCTPLVRASHAEHCLAALFDWFETSAERYDFMAWGMVSGDGPLRARLVDLFDARRTAVFEAEATTRALFRPAEDAESFLAQAPISGRHLKGIRRQARRLSEQGELAYLHLSSPADAKAWLEAYAAIEVAGWKGRAGTAFLAREADRAFFFAAMQAAADRGRLMMLGMRLDGRWIAMKCNVTAGDGAFALKITYDEAYASYSPGVLLEMENIRRLHDMRQVKWMDACAVPDHFMINRLWSDRRVIQTLLIATRKRGGLVLSLLPFARWMKRAVAAGGRK